MRTRRRFDRESKPFPSTQVDSLLSLARGPRTSNHASTVFCNYTGHRVYCYFGTLTHLEQKKGAHRKRRLPFHDHGFRRHTPPLPPTPDWPTIARKQSVSKSSEKRTYVNRSNPMTEEETIDGDDIHHHRSVNGRLDVGWRQINLHQPPRSCVKLDAEKARIPVL